MEKEVEILVDAEWELFTAKCYELAPPTDARSSIILHRAGCNGECGLIRRWS